MMEQCGARRRLFSDLEDQAYTYLQHVQHFPSGASLLEQVPLLAF